VSPLNPNNTGRFWLAYNDNVNDHEMMVRFNTGAAISTVMGYVNDFLQTLHDNEVIYLLTVLGARYSGAGSDISSPIVWTGAATYGAALMPLIIAPRETALLGRTSGGRRFRTFFYGLNITMPDTYRVPSAGGNWVEDALAVISAANEDGVYRAIDGLAPTLYTYADLQFNSYWETQRRG
jgi:hypothetical protein